MEEEEEEGGGKLMRWMQWSWDETATVPVLCLSFQTVYSASASCGPAAKGLYGPKHTRESQAFQLLYARPISEDADTHVYAQILSHTHIHSKMRPRNGYTQQNVWNDIWT